MGLKSEQLEEGWVKFIRHYCKEGYLDRWTGDCINDPNKATKNLMNLNSSACYWRCNNSEWISDRELGRSSILPMLEMVEEFTAQEIWDELKRI